MADSAGAGEVRHGRKAAADGNVPGCLINSAQHGIAGTDSPEQPLLASVLSHNSLYRPEPKRQRPAALQDASRGMAHVGARQRRGVRRPGAKAAWLPSRHRYAVWGMRASALGI